MLFELVTLFGVLNLLSSEYYGVSFLWCVDPPVLCVLCYVFCLVTWTSCPLCIMECPLFGDLDLLSSVYYGMSFVWWLGPPVLYVLWGVLWWLKPPVLYVWWSVLCLVTWTSCPLCIMECPLFDDLSLLSSCVLWGVLCLVTWASCPLVYYGVSFVW